VFQIGLALIFAVAWISLGVQLRVLIGARGLLPARELVAAAREAHTSLFELPTVFFWGAPDWALVAGVFVGLALAGCALLGVRARLAFALSTLLYLSYATLARTFLSFQWDNLLLECGAFAVLLPTDRPARWVHLLFRLILFKLYWESGVAKWQSHLRDWQDGSAMTFYYETAPIPAALAFYAHHAPVVWHHFESWATLAFELVLPFAIFGPRKVRQFAAAFFTAFQIINALTANYGFFCYLATLLHVFLLDDALLARLPLSLATATVASTRARQAGAAVVMALFVAVSLNDGLASFAGIAASPRLLELANRWRIINTYHLFGHITRERIEPELQTFDGKEWSAHDLHYKPGDVRRAPPYVAPHQPRVDFQLWFYGLQYRYQTPGYVPALLARMCHDPEAVQPLFVRELPRAPEAVRIVYWQYHFATVEERRADGAWWTRTRIDETRPIPCNALDAGRATGATSRAP
jgi:hypothetical protein